MRKPQRVEKFGKVYWIMGVPPYQADGKTEYAYGPYPNKQDAEQEWLAVMRTMKAWKHGEEFAEINPVPKDYIPIEPERKDHREVKRRRRRVVGGSPKRSGEASVIIIGTDTGDEVLGVESDGVSAGDGVSNESDTPVNVEHHEPDSVVRDEKPGECSSERVRKPGRIPRSAAVEYVYGSFGLIEYPFEWDVE